MTPVVPIAFPETSPTAYRVTFNVSVRDPSRLLAEVAGLLGWTREANHYESLLKADGTPDVQKLLVSMFDKPEFLDVDYEPYGCDLVDEIRVVGVI